MPPVDCQLIWSASPRPLISRTRSRIRDRPQPLPLLLRLQLIDLPLERGHLVGDHFSLRGPQRRIRKVHLLLLQLEVYLRQALHERSRLMVASV